MIRTLILFGATGDLAGRFLLPSLAALQASGRLPDDFRVVGSAREAWDDRAFQRHAAEALDEHAADLPVAPRRSLIGRLRYRQVDLEDARSVAAVVEATERRAVAAYLALPPALYPATIAALHRAELPEGSRVAVEKPFGEDLDTAIALNALLSELSGPAGEQAVFRVDHVLGMRTVQNLLALRLANTVLADSWDGSHIEQIEVLWEETLALEDRAGYYDHTGALKDVLQNHMLQVLCFLAMEPPESLHEKDLRDAKVAVLGSISPPARDHMTSLTRRARYAAGRIGDRDVRAYVDEHDVDPARHTETFAEVVVALESPRWVGTRFVLRGGKALGRRRKEAVVRFRPVATAPFGGPGAATELRIGIDGPEDVTLRLAGRRIEAQGELAPMSLTGDPPSSELPPYGHVLLDLLNGGGSLSIRGDEAEAAWRIVDPVLEAWRDNRVPLDEYPAGSAGPPPLSAIASDPD